VSSTNLWIGIIHLRFAVVDEPEKGYASNQSKSTLAPKSQPNFFAVSSTNLWIGIIHLRFAVVDEP
jgi:hypothetical protein